MNVVSASAESEKISSEIRELIKGTCSFLHNIIYNKQN